MQRLPPPGGRGYRSDGGVMNQATWEAVGSRAVRALAENGLYVFLGLAAFLFLGFALSLLLRRGRDRAAQRLVDQVLLEVESRHRQDLDAVLERMRESFRGLSLDALSASTEEFLKLAREKFETERRVTAQEMQGKKELIDQQLQRMNTELENVSKLVREFEQDRTEKFGALTGQLKSAGEQTASLLRTTQLLRQALASTQVRGQWGERMAEDVLRAAGFVENVNYLKQKTIQGTGSRPDFTFLLPRDFRLNMDVKFPLDNYLKYLEAPTEPEKQKFLSDFLRDVKGRVKEVTSREYICPEQNTLNYVLLFIPNEQVYGFLHEQDTSLLDGALEARVVLCSPITLFAVLAVIRQAMDNFTLEQTSNEILSLFGAFQKQWDEFKKKLDLVGRRIGDAQKEFDALTTTRRRQLEKPLRRIEEARTLRNLPPASPEEPGEEVSEGSREEGEEGDG
jgi:DNA recombination protein RmuC